MNSNLLGLVDVLKDTRTKLKQNVAFNDDGEMYFTSKHVENDMIVSDYNDSVNKSEASRHFLKNREIE